MSGYNLVRCDVCNGKGMVDEESTCVNCEGKGGILGYEESEESTEPKPKRKLTVLEGMAMGAILMGGYYLIRILIHLVSL